MRLKVKIFGIYSSDDTILAADLIVNSVLVLLKPLLKHTTFWEDCQNESASKLIASLRLL